MNKSEDEHSSGMGHSHNLDPSLFNSYAATDEPIGLIMALHITFMVTAFGILYPLGMVLGLAKNRWHVPVQVLGTALFVIGLFLAHAHNGRNYEPHIAHRWFANIVIWTVILQVVIGAFLKLHLERGIYGKIRPVISKIHKVMGASIPVIGYVQIVLGVIASVGFCYGDHTGQCLAHFIMGSSFVAYGILLLMMLRVGGPWLLRNGKSQEWYDSWVIMLWGIVNTFTEHRWGQPWNHGDYQHTSMGIIWWAAGLLGIVLSRNGKRSVIPSVLIILTAVSFQGHAQHVPNSGIIHSYFGYMLAAGGLSRIIEICFVWKENNVRDIAPFQYLPPLTLMLSGLLFMGSTEEQLNLLNVIGVDVMSYSNVLLTFGFVVFTAAFSLIYLWEYLTDYGDSAKQNRGYAEVYNGDAILSASSAFLDDDDEVYNNSSEHDVVEMKTTTTRNNEPHHTAVVSANVA
ncbi:putative integral membrane protein [Mycotypha africana]|uniref:putative integral membrane protein n=1 Tax=Mycotypha africana TaxID=64632 RepID=UPI002301C3E8|nr:putative integral membrane protein [Mycotypha africana]KAI8992103.1 putative integral membrane protein [Mycotypha africana]